MRSAPPSVLACLCVSILWSGLCFLWVASRGDDGLLAWCLAPILVGGLMTPWQSVRRQGIALALGPAVLAVTYVVVLLWIAILGMSWSAISS